MTTTLRPSPRCLGLLAAGMIPALAPVLLDQRLWLLWPAFAGLLVILLVVDGVLGPRAADLEAELPLPESLPVGEVYEAELRYLARYGRTLHSTLSFDLSANLSGPDRLRGRLGMDGAAATVPLRPLRRGMALVETVWLRYTGPLGLCQRTVCLPLEQPVRVVPSINAVRSMALLFANPREHSVGLKIERVAGDGSEFQALREYLPGLDSRSIDWKASARHTRLLCREYRAERNHHIVLAVDTGRLMAEELSGMPRLDHAIHSALLLSYLSLRAGDRVSLYSFDANPGQLSPPCAGVSAFPNLLRMSANLAYTTAETNFTLGLAHLMSLLRRRSLVIVMTDHVDAVTGELMADNLLHLARRHLVLCVALRDPLLDTAEHLEPTTLAAMERAVVIDSLARDRELVLRRLQRAGVLCIDTVPLRLGARLINQYLEIKRREMI